MYLVAIAWMYVVVMMAVAEATSTTGTVLGAAFTFLLYGVMPLSIVLYLLGTPARKRRRVAAEAAEAAAALKADGSHAEETDRIQHVGPDADAPAGASGVGPVTTAGTSPSDHADSAPNPDRGRVSPGDPVAPEGKKP